MTGGRPRKKERAFAGDGGKTRFKKTKTPLENLPLEKRGTASEKIEKKSGCHGGVPERSYRKHSNR